ncbi:hypothetical protein AB0P15_36220 [Streptomyces sp. NPDC087917]|uniref:hypothetical protein n=1 Tax=Streptomyces sp. NPDC087917 TaxID=3155060 RepID=UPI0034132AB6
MGRFTDKWTGTKHPRTGTPRQPAPELRVALLALNGPRVRFAVREGTAKENADLVAEFELPALEVTLKTRMRLNPEAYEVRVLEERWEPTADSARRQYGRGPADKVYRQWETTPGSGGHGQKAETSRFGSHEMRARLQRVVLDAGWTWRGTLLKF